MDTSTAKAEIYDTDFTIFIICQKQTEERLVEKPTAHCKVLEFTRERARYGDGHYPEVSRRLGKLTSQDLKSKDASLHRSCYQHTVTQKCTTELKRGMKRTWILGADPTEESPQEIAHQSVVL